MMPGYEPGALDRARRLRNKKWKWKWLRGPDLNLRPSGYGPDALPDCATPQHVCSSDT